MSEENKQKLRKYSKNKYYNMSQESRQQMKEYMKEYMKEHKKRKENSFE